MASKVLLVEDEKSLGETLTAYLRRDSFDVKLVCDGAEVMALFEQWQPAIVLLDLMLPNVDGISLCRQIRQISQVPIIMLTARVDVLDRLLGLEIGADDYVCKPYSPREVVARVKTVLRRCLPEGVEPGSTGVTTSPLTMDENSLDARWRGTPLNLTTMEFRLLSAMVNEPRRVFSREQLMSKIYNDYRVVSDRTIDSHITKLRRKLASATAGEEIIRSVYGAGYKFELPL